MNGLLVVPSSRTSLVFWKKSV